MAPLQEALEPDDNPEQPLPAEEEPTKEEKPEEEVANEESPKDPESTPAEEKIKKTPTKEQTTVKTSPLGSSADEDSGTSKMQVIFVVVLGLVIVVALGATFLGRKKK